MYLLKRLTHTYIHTHTHRRLRTNLGLERYGSFWQTAWRIYLPPTRAKNILASSASRLAVCLAAYLCIDGFDWLATMAGVSGEIANGTWDGALLLVTAYLLRHGFMYWQVCFGVDVLFGLWCLGYVCLIDGVVYVCTGVLRLDVLCLCVLVFIGKTLF